MTTRGRPAIGGRTTLNLSEPLRQAVETWAGAEGMNVSEAVRVLLTIALLHELVDQKV